MYNGRRSLLLFEMRLWDKTRLIDFVAFHVNEPLRRYGISLTPEEFLAGTIYFILDFNCYQHSTPERAVEQLEDYLDTLLNNFVDEGEFIIEEIDRRRLLMAFNDLADFIANDILRVFEKANLSSGIEILSINIRNRAFSLSVEEPEREMLW